MTFDQLALLHLIPTTFMAGVIWFVQVVHYPLFRAVGERAFRSYEERHTVLTTWVVLPPMVAELGLSLWLLLQAPADAAAIAWVGSGAGMMPSFRAKVRAPSKHSICGIASASTRPSSYRCETSGAMP